MDAARPPARILPAIAVAQFCGTAPWFAINAVMADLQRGVALPAAAVGWLSAAVQLGFIVGTLVFALLAIADRFSPRLVFLASALAGAGLAAATAALPPQLDSLLALRFATGFFLAGIYPVGMKIASGWFVHGLGWALGVMVGALVLGTALPFGLRALGASWPWQTVMLTVAAISAGGGVLMALLVPDGPHLAPAQRISPRALGVIWTDGRVRASAFGYFGHMWELYALYVLMPAIVATRFAGTVASWWVFAGIGVGLLSCTAGGLLARRLGGARVAGVLLATSGLCGLVSPWMLEAPVALWGAWLILWGATAAGDSPQFSALTAGNAPRAVVGSVLTFVNSIGFSITTATIALFVALAAVLPLPQVLPWLALGPAIGLWFLSPLWRANTPPP